MIRICSKGATCVAQTRGILLTDDHFRKGSFPPQSLELWRRCSLWRGTRAVIISQGSSRVWSHCHYGQESYLFRDRDIRLFSVPSLTAGRDYDTCRRCRASNLNSARRARPH